MTSVRWAILLVGVAALITGLSVRALPAPEPSAQLDRPFPDLPLPPQIDTLHGLADAAPGARQLYLDRLTREAIAQGLPPAVADAVASVESGYDSTARGAAGEIGLMQILPATAAMLGHTGSAVDLMQPETNIRYGVLYLAQAWRLTNGDLCRSLMKYRAGHGEERMTPLSIQYCARARAHLASIGSSLAEAPVPTAVSSLTLPPPGISGAAKRKIVLAALPSAEAVSPGPRRNRSAADSRRFWAAHEARIRIINAKIAARWRRTAQN
jgi:hypothetical protein